MSWTTPITFKPGQYAGEGVGQDSLNTFIRDNLQYLYDNKVDNKATKLSVSRGFNQWYQAGLKARLVFLSGYTDNPDYPVAKVDIYIQADQSAQPAVARVGRDNGSISDTFNITFVVPPSYWYKITETGYHFYLHYWTERDLGA